MKKLGLFKETDVEKLEKLVRTNRGNVKFHEEEKDMMKGFDINTAHHAICSLSVKEMDSHSSTKICRGGGRGINLANQIRNSNGQKLDGEPHQY